MPKILLTGFGPFPGAPFNPTGQLVRRLAVRRRPAFADLERIAHVFATGYAAVDAELPALMERHRPDAILLFGLAMRSPYMRVEIRARNAINVRLPDAKGATPLGRAIRAGGGSLRGRAPFRRLLAAARNARVPARLSHDAGAYLCNYAYWHALAPSVRSGRPLIAFVHVPLPGRKLKRRGRPIRFDDLMRAGEAILVELATAVRASR
jgi:pyroglutamyl-peptidase